MNIGRVNHILESYQSHTAKRVQERRGVKSVDEVRISNEGRYFEIHDIAKRAAAGIPDIREDKVATVSKKLENGRYTVTAAQIAKKLFETGV